MRRTLFALGFCLTACGPASVEATPVNDGRVLADAPISRCMNLGSALEANFEGEWGYKVRREDLQRLKQDGFDTVRLPVKWSAYALSQPPYTIDSAIMARVSEIIGWAEAEGLNIIVNVHHYDELNEDPETHEPRLEAIWDQLAAYYASTSEKVIFETINEPHTNLTTPRTDALNTRILARIREDNPTRWVILGTAFWGNLSALEESRPTYDPRAMLTLHDYSPFDFTHQGAPWTDQTRTGIRWGTRKDVEEMLDGLDRAVKVQEAQRMPVFVGEFGVYDGVPIEARARWTKTMRTGLEARGLGWCYWDFAGSLKAYDLGKEAWLPEIKAALLD